MVNKQQMLMIERTILTYAPRVTCILLAVSNAILYMWEVDQATSQAVLFANALILGFLALSLHGPGELRASEDEIIVEKVM
ncbi:hypothetical protein ONS95_008188 [Cadophora gregata]|uniref:uncharacterized protein n=1 Tax=Cadophora gregata TaxID=51156 RepID=UPI0026DC427A|nr:uncharacterized protein ONS95_008188 [Cadophora gregata]KAK0100223.1 hypothetical protein ONS96_007508 [Cadophora gregata f. sp. sojae]KAK0119346.1 hypothetical protein ONS96_012399 [Cadophora gregata f. sp. sojae]KAK0126600.1 hypothetical protein ONS95_008188 [Cadophora gregata]